MTFSKVKEILAQHKGIDPEKIKEDSTFTSLGLDSLDTVELIMQFEDEFGVTLSVSEDLKTVGDFVKLINSGKKDD
jgi:acyl carrier protein